MDLNLQGKIAVVTGASKGLGRAIVVGLASEGCRIALVARDKKQLEEMARILPKAADPLVVVQDVTADDAAERIHETVIHHFGRCDILANCAGRSASQGDSLGSDLLWQESMLL